MSTRVENATPDSGYVSDCVCAGALSAWNIDVPSISRALGEVCIVTAIMLLGLRCFVISHRLHGPTFFKVVVSAVTGYRI